MSGLFSTPKMPSIVTPPKPTMPASPLPEPVVKAEEKKKIRKGATGQTILTGPKGVLTKAPVTKKFLLGE